MNKIQLKILECLSENCLMSTAKLAKAIKKPRHIVAYHKAQLIKQKVILGNELILNYSALGFEEVIIYLKLFHYSKIKEKLIPFLTNHPNVKWVAEVFPNYTLRVVFIVKNISELEDIVGEISKVCGNNLLHKEVLFSKEFIKKESYTTKDFVTNTKPVGEMVLNKTEKELIKNLFEDPTSSLSELAKKTSLSIEGVRQKIKKFKDTNLIRGFSVKIDSSKVGFNFWAVLFINLNNLKANLKKLRALLYSDVCYGRTRRTFGNFNIEMTLFVSSYKQFIRIIRNLEKVFGEDFESHDLIVYIDRFLSHRIPDVFFSE